MDTKKGLQQAFGFSIVALLLAGCAGVESAPPAATVVPTNTSTPTDSPPPPTAVVSTDFAVRTYPNIANMSKM
jgi:hypothetical protein